MGRRISRIFMPAVLFAALAWLGVAIADPGDASAPISVVILHTNDLHGRVYPQKATWLDRENPPEVGGFAALAAAIRRERAAAWRENKVVFLVDAGDWFQGTPEGDIPRGRLVTEWMNLVGYDLATIGNHEFDKGADLIADLAKIARFPFLGANIGRAKGPRPEWRTGSRAWAVGGTDVVFVGLITRNMRGLVVPEAIAGLEFEDEVQTLKKYIEPGQITIPVTHCGVDRDVEIATATGVPLVIGGHSHTGLPNGKLAPNGSLVCQCFAHGSVLGKIEFTIDGGKLSRPVASHIQIRPADGEDPETKALIARYAADIDVTMDEIVGRATAAMTRSGNGSSSLGNWVCDVMREKAGVQVAFTNRTGIRADLAAGEIRRRDMYLVNPFSNTLVTLEMTGADLDALLEYSVGAAPVFLEVSGLAAVVDPASPEGKRVTIGTVAGEPWAADREYRVVTNSFLARGGDGHLAFTRGKALEESGVDMLEAQIEVCRQGALKPDTTQRIKFPDAR